MKYLLQFGIIMAVSFAGELFHDFLPLPVPASIYGILILFSLLRFKILHVAQIKECHVSHQHHGIPFPSRCCGACGGVAYHEGGYSPIYSSQCNFSHCLHGGNRICRAAPPVPFTKKRSPEGGVP